MFVFFMRVLLPAQFGLNISINSAILQLKRRLHAFISTTEVVYFSVPSQLCLPHRYRAPFFVGRRHT